MSQSRSHASDYLRVLYRRRWTAAAAFLLVFAYGAAGSLRKAPVFEANAQLIVANEVHARTLRSRTLAWRTLEGLGLSRPRTDLDEVVTVAEAPESGVVERLAVWLGAPRVIETPAGDETAWQSGQIDAFLAGVTVAPVSNSRLTTLTYRSVDPIFAAKAANALSERATEAALTTRLFAARGGDTVLNHQVKVQRQRLMEGERALQRYTEEHGTPSLSDRQESASARKVADVSAELTRARMARLEQEAIHNQWLELRKQPDTLDAFPALQADDVTEQLWEEITDLRVRDGHLAAAGYGLDREDRRKLGAALRVALTELQDRIDVFVAAVLSDVEAAREREAALERQVESIRGQAQGADREVSDYVALERAVLGDRRLHDHLVQQIKDARLESATTTGAVQVVEAASVPRRPILPNRGRDMTRALAIAVLLAVGLAFGTEFLDSRLKNPDDIKAHLGLPFLGLVPSVSARHTRGGRLLLNRGVPPGFAEALRSVRTAVNFSTAAVGARSLMVTSTAPSEGKTVMSSNLGLALAQAELRTLVIDGDMRRPRIHEVFGVDQEPGLSNVLVGTASLEQAIRATDSPFLAVLPAGHVPPNPAELLSSPRYRRLIEELGAQYDWIVVDAPPVMAVTDAAVVSHSVSGVVFVVGAEMIPRRTAQNAIEQLTQAQAKIIGIVLNRAEVARHAFYYAPYERKEYAPVDAPRL